MEKRGTESLLNFLSGALIAVLLAVSIFVFVFNFFGQAQISKESFERLINSIESLEAGDEPIKIPIFLGNGDKIFIISKESFSKNPDHWWWVEKLEYKDKKIIDICKEKGEGSCICLNNDCRVFKDIEFIRFGAVAYRKVAFNTAKEFYIKEKGEVMAYNFETGKETKEEIYIRKFKENDNIAVSISHNKEGVFENLEEAKSFEGFKAIVEDFKTCLSKVPEDECSCGFSNSKLSGNYHILFSGSRLDIGPIRAFLYHLEEDGLLKPIESDDIGGILCILEDSYTQDNKDFIKTIVFGKYLANGKIEVRELSEDSMPLSNKLYRYREDNEDKDKIKDYVCFVPKDFEDKNLDFKNVNKCE